MADICQAIDCMTGLNSSGLPTTHLHSQGATRVQRKLVNL